MCTVTYLPLLNSGFLLTSSRDEKAARPAAVFPVTHQVDDQVVCFPQDLQSSGTWVAASARLTVCLLNGAFRAHVPHPPYRHSRGLVVLAVFAYPSPADWLTNYNFIGIEPFTLVIVQSERYGGGRKRAGHQPVERLWEVRWDGQATHVRLLDPQRPQIWSSATLYTDDVIARRQQWFGNWLRGQPTGSFTVDAIRDFHKQAGSGDNMNAVRMNRGNGMQTLSLTSIRHEGTLTTMYYEDFLTNMTHHHQLDTTHEHVFAH